MHCHRSNPHSVSAVVNVPSILTFLFIKVFLLLIFGAVQTWLNIFFLWCNVLFDPFSFTIVNVKKRPTTTQLTHLSRAHALFCKQK